MKTVQWKKKTLISMIDVSTARRKINLMGAIAMMDVIVMAVNSPTTLSWVTLLPIANAAAIPLRQVTMVRMAGDSPNRRDSICFQ